MLNKPAAIPKVIIYIVLVLITLAVFWQVNQFDFINLDDNIYVTENSHIQSGITLEGIRWAFSTTYAEFWHPLTWLSLMVDYQIYGLSAGGYHVTHLILHILSTLLLFWLFCRMTGEVWKSAFVAAFFALHPLHVESVVWISERKDVLSAFFWMLTLCLYVYYTEKPAVKRYLLVLASFVLALMSKPMVVTLPVIMILLDYWPLKRFESRKDHLFLWQVKEKLPFFILSGIFSIITIYAHTRNSLKSIPLLDRAANALVFFATYLKKMLWPFDLILFYPISEQIILWQTLISLFLILTISVFVMMTMKRLPYLFAGWLWYAITILPVLGITYTGVHWMHDTYTYLPMIGISIGLIWGIPSLITGMDPKASFGNYSAASCGILYPLLRRIVQLTHSATLRFRNGSFTITNDAIRQKILFATAIVILFIMSMLTWKQCGYWKNSIELFNHNLHVTNNNYLAYDHRGIAYGQIAQYHQSIDNFNKAIGLKPDYAKGYNNRGFAYSKIGKFQNAINDYDEAIRLKPDYAKAYNNRANAYFNQGNTLEGCEDAQKACQMGSCVTLQDAKFKGYCIYKREIN